MLYRFIILPIFSGSLLILGIALILCKRYIKNPGQNNAPLPQSFALVVGLLSLFANRIYIFFSICILSNLLAYGVDEAAPEFSQASYFIYIFFIFVIIASTIMDLSYFVFYNTRDPSSNLAWANNNYRIDIERYMNKILLIAAYYFDSSVI